MKELKAVEILEEYRSILVDSSIMGEECGEDVSSDDEEIASIEQALAELAELTQEKSCEGCERWNYRGLDKGICLETKSSLYGKKTTSDICCKYYTPKEQQ